MTATPTCREALHVCALLLYHLGDDELELVCLCGGGGAGQGQCLYKKNKSKARRDDPKARVMFAQGGGRVKVCE